MHVIAFDEIYIIYQFHFGIRMCSKLAKCRKSSEMRDPEFLTQLILDAPFLFDIRDLNFDQLGSLELCTREYISVDCCCSEGILG